MDSPPSQTRSAAGVRRWRLVIFTMLAVLAAVAVILIPTGDDKNLAWLNPADLAPAPSNGVITVLKNKLRAAIWPILWRIRRSQPHILVTARFLGISDAASEHFSLGSPLSTNANGVRAWILSPAELSSFKQCLKTNSGIETLAMPQVQTVNGGQARVSIGNTVMIGTNKVETGAIVDILPKAFPNSVKLTVSARFTSFLGYDSNSVPLIQTIFADTACRVSVPDTGALVIKGRDLTGSGSNCWLVLVPTLIDSKGKPIRY